jgi:tight adherence protein C
MIPLIVAGLITAAVLLVGWATSSFVVERAELRASLRRLEGYQIQDVRDKEMLAPITERVFAPLLEGMTRLSTRVTPQGYREQMERKLVLAGNPSDLEVDHVLVLKLMGTVSGLLWLPLVLLVFQLHGIIALFFIAVFWFGSFMMPDIYISRAIEQRKHDIAVQLPDILDLLVISVEAGLGFEQALERTATAVPGPLSEESRRMLQETRMGASRADALRALDERTQVDDLRTFIMALLQADAFGVSIARILRAQADEIRIRRRQVAQEASQKAPIKMLFPLAVCIFPAVFVVVLLPAVIQIFRNF